MRLIGLSGPAGVGKSTVASILRDRHGFLEVAFAQPVYEAVSAALGVPVSALKDRALKEEPVPWLGKSPRHLLRTLGTEWGRGIVRQDLWIRVMERTLDGLDAGKVVVSDVRFEDEAAFVRERGGQVWHLRREGVRWSGEHGSEAGIAVLPEDRVVACLSADWRSTVERASRGGKAN